MEIKTCGLCNGYIIAGSCKCEYNKKHGIYNFTTLAKLVEQTPNIDDILFNVNLLQGKLTDFEITKLCDLYFRLTGRLDESGKLFNELYHMNEVLTA